MSDDAIISAEELAAIRARYQAATPGPWMQHELYPKVIVAASAPEMSLLSVDAEGIATFWSPVDAALAAHSRTDIESLDNALTAALAEIERLKGGGK